MARPKMKLLDTYCVYCGREHAVQDFYKSPNPHHTSGYIPICKDGAKKIFDEYLVKTGAVDSALWYTCSINFGNKRNPQLRTSVPKSRIHCPCFYQSL